jgi:hypothetical protein
VSGSEGVQAPGFDASRQRFESLVGFLAGEGASSLTHHELESRLAADGRELIRGLLQDHLDLRAAREARIGTVADTDGVAFGAVEPGHGRSLTTIFGEVTVSRMAYRHRGALNLHPADASLNLPQGIHSFGLAELAAVEASRGSFGEAQAAITQATGMVVGKRQIEALANAAAEDFDDFYASQPRPEPGDNDVVVVSVDAKGIVMRPEALRPATAAKAEASGHKLTTRLSAGEKANRKRMAEVGAVYQISPVARTPADILPAPGAKPAQAPKTADQPKPAAAPKPPEAPKAAAKWLTASVVDDAAVVVGKVFDEAERRDPSHSHTWVALVDGNNHQITRIKAEAKARGASPSIVVDFIHVLEYLWGAAWCFYWEGDANAETWVRTQALSILEGRASTVAAAIRRKATCLGLLPDKRAGADRCADYLLNKAPYLHYHTALEKGWPIATGVIEGACRHLVKDRMDLTGARWGLEGAEAVLKLRALRSNGDFPAYWAFHLAQERRRNHESRYANGVIPQAA